MKAKRPPRKRIPVPPDLPYFCDFSCPYADFADARSVGACRKEQAVTCTLFKKQNNKHTVCLGRKKGA